VWLVCGSERGFSSEKCLGSGDATRVRMRRIIVGKCDSFQGRDRRFHGEHLFALVQMAVLDLLHHERDDQRPGFAYGLRAATSIAPLQRAVDERLRNVVPKFA